MKIPRGTWSAIVMAMITELVLAGLGAKLETMALLDLGSGIFTFVYVRARYKNGNATVGMIGTSRIDDSFGHHSHSDN